MKNNQNKQNYQIYKHFQLHKLCMVLQIFLFFSCALHKIDSIKKTKALTEKPYEHKKHIHFPHLKRVLSKDT